MTKPIRNIEEIDIETLGIPLDADGAFTLRLKDYTHRLTGDELVQEMRDQLDVRGSVRNALLRKAVGKVADGQMIAALGTIPAETAAADDSAAVRAAFQEMAAQLIREAGQRMRWILSPQAVAMLAPFAPADRIEVNLDGTGTIFGAPIMVSTALPAGDLLLVSASDVAANLIDAEIEASDEADITMINAEDATHVVSMWQTNSVAVRTILAFGLEPLRDTVAARLTLTEGA